MKNINWKIVLVLLFFSCGSSKSFQSFFDTHKTDIGVTAFQVPNFMKTLLSNISPKQNMFDNLTDFKFITFNNTSSQRQKKLIHEMNVVASSKFTDMYRENTTESTKIISVKERGNIVSEAIIFNSKINKTTVFYIKGQFDPEKIKAFSNDSTLYDFSNKLQQQYQIGLNPPINPSFNPNN